MPVESDRALLALKNHFRNDRVKLYFKVRCIAELMQDDDMNGIMMPQNPKEPSYLLL